MPRQTRRKTLKDQPEKVIYNSTEKYKSVKPMNQEQAEALRMMRENKLSIILAKAGCGKTHLACGIGAELLQNGAVEKVILIRENVEVGKPMGFLPGEKDDKIAPYGNVMLSELNYFLNTKPYTAQNKIVVEPISFIRGATLKNSFVIVDEVQNIDENALKTILTRFGNSSKFVLIGDLRQNDIRKSEADQTAYRLKRLANLADNRGNIGYMELYKNVRDPLIDLILQAWDE